MFEDGWFQVEDGRKVKVLGNANLQQIMVSLEDTLTRLRCRHYTFYLYWEAGMHCSEVLVLLRKMEKDSTRQEYDKFCADVCYHVDLFSETAARFLSKTFKAMPVCCQRFLQDVWNLFIAIWHSQSHVPREKDIISLLQLLKPSIHTDNMLCP